MALSSLTTQNIPVVIRALLASRGADVTNLRNNRIIALINNALETLAYRVAKGADYKGLQAEFSATPTAGVLTLTSGMIFDLARSTIRDSSATTLTAVDSLFTLTHGVLPLGQIYYTLEGSKLRFRNTDGVLNTFASPLTITANFIPVLGTLPVEYNELFFSTLAELLTTAPAPRAQELAEVGRV